MSEFFQVIDKKYQTGPKIESDPENANVKNEVRLRFYIFLLLCAYVEDFRIFHL